MVRLRFRHAMKKAPASAGEFLDALHADRRQPGGGAASPRDAAIGSDLEQRHEDEGAQVHARVRQLQLRRVDRCGVVEQQIEIERAALAPRGADCSLNTGKIQKLLSFQLSDALTGLQKMKKER